MLLLISLKAHFDHAKAMLLALERHLLTGVCPMPGSGEAGRGQNRGGEGVLGGRGEQGEEQFRPH